MKLQYVCVIFSGFLVSCTAFCHEEWMYDSEEWMYDLEASHHICVSEGKATFIEAFEQCKSWDGSLPSDMQLMEEFITRYAEPDVQFWAWRDGRHWQGRYFSCVYMTWKDGQIQEERGLCDEERYFICHREEGTEENSGATENSGERESERTSSITIIKSEDEFSQASGADAGTTIAHTAESLTADDNAKSGEGSDLAIGLPVGLAVGIGVFIAFTVFIIVVLVRRKRRKRCNCQGPPSLEAVDNAISGGKSWTKRLKHHFINETRKTEPARKDRTRKETKDHVYENSPIIQNSQQKGDDHIVHIYENAVMNKPGSVQIMTKLTDDQEYEEPVKITKDKNYEVLVKVDTKDKGDEVTMKKITKYEDYEERMKIAKAHDNEQPMKVIKDQGYEEPVKITKDQNHAQPMKVIKDQGYEEPVKITKDQGYEEPVKITKDQNYEEPMKITKDQDHEEPMIITNNQEYINTASSVSLNPDGKQENHPEYTDESVSAEERYVNSPEQKGKPEDTSQQVTRHNQYHVAGAENTFQQVYD